MSILTNTLFAQNPEEVEIDKSINELITTYIPNLSGQEYFVASINSDYTVISKINNVYTYYLLLRKDTGIEVTGVKTINPNPVLDRIFINFTPLPNVKRYVSEYGYNIKQNYFIGLMYFSIFKNGKTIFSSLLPNLLTASVDGPQIDNYPLDDEIFSFIFYKIISTPNQL